MEIDSCACSLVGVSGWSFMEEKSMKHRFYAAFAFGKS
jgi:hypothetical protein